jgi:hypothetical protein
MPGIIPQQSLYQLIFNLQQQINAVALQQTGGITNSSGIAVVKYGALPNGDYGYAVYDSTGNLRVQMGELPSGDYGIEIVDPTGHSNEIWPVSSAFGNGGTLGSAGPATITGSPSVTSYLGASGDCLITVSAGLEATEGVDANVYLVIDGTPYFTRTALGLSIANMGASAQIFQNCSSTFRLSQWYGSALTANASHTFSLEYEGATGLDFSEICIVIQPL